MTQQLDVTGGRDVIARWCALAEQRLEYLTELFETGRWRRFHSERDFLENIQEARAAVDIWRGLSSREASRDNRTIDMSWVGRAPAAPPRGEIWRDPVHLPKPAEISAQEPLENPIVPEAEADTVATEPTLSRQVMDGDASEPAQDPTAIAERYPLLRNAL